MRTLFLSIYFFFVSAFLALPVSAQQPASATVSQGAEGEELQHGPYFFVYEKVTLDEELYTGTVFVAGGEVTVNGTIAGDLVVVGGTIRVLGDVQQDVYAAGGSVTIAGTVLGNVVAAGGEVSFTETAEIGDSTILAGENLRLSGTVLNKVFLGGSNVTVIGDVMSDAQVMTEKLILTPTAFIGGNLQGKTGDEPAIASEAEIMGETALERLPEKNEQAEQGMEWGAKLFIAVWLFVSQTLFAWFLLWMWPNLLPHKAAMIEKEVMQLGLRGIAVIVLSPVAMIVLASTILLLPLAGMFLWMYLSLLFVAGIFVYLPIGRRIVQKDSAYLQVAVGSAVMSLLGILPIIGWVLRLFAVAVGVGTLFLGKRK